MRNTLSCPKCGSRSIVRIPGNPRRYVCCGCGYTENWVEKQKALGQIKRRFG